MPSRSRSLPPESMTPDQLHCYRMLCDWRGGAHHLGPVLAWGLGIRTPTSASALATYDLGSLTSLVFLAHDRCVRVELAQSGPGQVAVICHRRHTREGGAWERHPSIEEALAIHRRSFPAPDHEPTPA